MTEHSAAHPILTINARGEITGDVSQIPAETLENLLTPEAQEQMRRMYRKEFGSGRRETRSKVEEVIMARGISQERRDFRHLCPPGMSNKEFKKIRRKYMKQQTKAVLKEISHGSN